MFFRLINPQYETVNEVRRTDTTELTPKSKRIIEISPLLCATFVFWQRTGVQLSTAMDALLQLKEHYGDIQNLIKIGENSVPTKIFNKHETIEGIPLDDFLYLMESGYKQFVENGLEFIYNDLPYVWEYLWEVVRSSFFKDKISRMSCLFLYDNISQAKSLQFQIDPMKEYIIAEVFLLGDSKLEKYDAGWLDLLSVNCTFNEFVEACRNYWEGKESTKPSWEYLYEGLFTMKVIS